MGVGKMTIDDCGDIVFYKKENPKAHIWVIHICNRAIDEPDATRLAESVFIDRGAWAFRMRDTDED